MNIFKWLNDGFKGGYEQPENTTAFAPKDVAVDVIKPTPKLYTAEDVHRDLTAFVLMFLADIQQEIERKEVPATISLDAALLSEFGLTRSKNAVIANNLKKEVYAHNKEYDRKKATIAFMERVWKKFGKDAMVVRYDHFFKILDKYDMVCGSFDRYLGGVPQEALNVLSYLKELWEEDQFSSEYGLPLSYTSSFTFKDELHDIRHLRNLARMPMRVSDKNIMQQIAKVCFLSPDYLGVSEPRYLRHINDALFIAAPAADMKQIEIRVDFDSSFTQSAAKRAIRQAERIADYLPRWRREEIQNEAIRKEENRLQSIIEKSDVARYCEINFIKTKPLPERKLYDPFICSLTPYGVLIHAKWGAEAEDATIKRYEQLRDAIIGKGGEA